MMFYIIILIPFASSLGSTTWISEGVECVTDEESTIAVVNAVDTLEECRHLCEETEECQYITYRGYECFPLYHHCSLLKSCNETRSCRCSECVSETISFHNSSTCGRDIENEIGENLIETILNIDSEYECKELCHQTSDCSFYTHLNESTCHLLSRLADFVQSCDDCVTGPGDCDDNDDINDMECSFFVNGEYENHVMITDPGEITNLTVVSNSLFYDCQLRMLLVGGGGDADNGYGSGAGSGYITYVNMTNVREGSNSKL